MHAPDVVIAGAGLIGMACALECHRRGLRVAVLERGRAGQEASWAAAGMLAAHDPVNPAVLQPLSDLSLSLYPAFLDRVRDESGVDVPIETEWTLEQAEGAFAEHAPANFPTAGFLRIREQSLNPRILTAAVAAAVRNSSIVLLEGMAVQSYRSTSDGVRIIADGKTIHCGQFLDCTGAWSTAPVRPAKGQMLRLHAPGALTAGDLGNMVVRTPEVYLVPRLDGSVVVGATVEDAGFSKTLHEADLENLHKFAKNLVPALATALRVESWAGLRPTTVDFLPLLGSTGEHIWIASGHFRNGVLLTPGTAHLLAGLLCGEVPGLDLTVFSPERFAVAAS